LQFDTIIGSEAFIKQKKYVFRAAADEVLYKQAQKVLLEPRTKSQFLVLETISSHKPYDTPLGKDEESAFRYSDDQLLEFYRQLQSMHYFDNGILIVVGDHRKMQAM
jgi:lipoteichoic acid synthase